MLAFGEAEIGRTIEARTLERGRELVARGQVLEIDVNTNGSVIVSRVKGTKPRPYQQMITLRAGNNGTIIHGTCSCPVHTNCKHVAATLLAASKTGAQRLAPSATSATSGLVATSGPVATHQDGLSSKLRAWLGDIDAAISHGAASNDYPPEIRQRLIYVLEVPRPEDAVTLGPCLKAMVATLNKTGHLGARPRPYLPSNIKNYQPAKHLRPIDYEILTEWDVLMPRFGGRAGSGLPLRANPQIVPLLIKILSTGRCRLGSVHGPALQEGPTIAAQLRWGRQDGSTGDQRLIIEAEPDGDGVISPFDAVLPLSPPFYIAASSGQAGPLDLGLPPALAACLAEAPVVSSSEATQLAALLPKHLAPLPAKQRVPLPDVPDKTETLKVVPVPRLELYLGDVRVKQRLQWYAHEQRHAGVIKLPLARLTFDYDGAIVPIHAATEVLERFDDGVLILTPRDTRAELVAHDRLGELGLKPLRDSLLDANGDSAKDLYFAPDGAGDVYSFLASFDDPGRFIAFSTDCIPHLVAEGWQVSYSDDYPYRIAEGEVGWWADVDEGSGIDWFAFELGIEFEGQRINLAPKLAELLARLPTEIKDLLQSDRPEDTAEVAEICSGLRLHHRLDDGRLLPLPADRLVPVLKALMELIGPRTDTLKDGRVHLHRAEAAALAAASNALGDGVAWAASAERLVALGETLRRGLSLKAVRPPASLKAKLRPYQQQGLAWLDFLRESGFGGVLADDMGLGKTLQALAFLMREKAQGRLNQPALIVAPTSVLPNWQAEATHFTPDLKVLTLHGFNRKQLFGDIASHDIVLTTYPLLPRDHAVLLSHEFHAAILDEAQAIKNPKATVSQFAHAIKAHHRIALTGTPLENNLGEVWSLFQFLSPGLLGDETTFRRTFRTPIEKHGCQAAQSFLTRRLKPFMLRRTKQEVAKELPPKTEIVERVRLEGAQRDLYETVRVLMHDKVRDEIARKGLAKSHIVFLDALLKLRQICCDPRLLKMQQSRKVKRSAKLERLREMLPEMVDEGRRILLFSQFTSMLDLIKPELDRLKIPYVTLTGSTKDRATPVRAFQAGAAPVFLLSLKAGGTGLNLTAADTVIHYDPWWNPAVEAQATDRAYRIGQDKPVFVHKLMVEEGIEEAIEQLKARKAALAEALFAGASKSGLDLTEADISALFAPLDREALRKAA
jgi:superfamily II DNA or RNA helicase